MSKLTCPSCGAEMSLDVLIAHAELRQATIALIEKSLSLGSLVTQYIGLFRPLKNKLSDTRWAKLIIQLQPDLQRNAITHKGRDWHIPLDCWKQGMEAVLERAATNKLTLPLDNHAYLYTVLAGMADKVEASAEAQAEAARRVTAKAPDLTTSRVNTDRGFTSVADVMAAQRQRSAKQ